MSIHKQRMEETRLFLTICTYTYEYMDASLVSDFWWDVSMREAMPSLADTGMWIREVHNHVELQMYAEQIMDIMKKHRRKEALLTMLVSPHLWS